MLKKIIPCLLVLAIVFSFAVPVHAHAIGELGSTLVQYKDAITGLVDDYAMSYEVDFDMDGKLDKTYGGCTVAADGNHIINDFGPSLAAPGLASHGTCSMCHQGLGQIVAYDKEHGGETGTYQDYVKQNYPLDGYGSDGGFYWYPTAADIYQVSFDFNALKSDDDGGIGGSFKYSRGSFGAPSNPNFSVSASFSGNKIVGSISCLKPDYSILWCCINFFTVLAPLDGYYQPVSCISMSSDLGTVNYHAGDSYFYSFGEQILNGSVQGIRTSGGFVGYFPCYKVVPSQEVNNNYYVRSSRVGSITYNIVDSHMQNYYPNVQFFNEETNIYVDPSTGQQQNVQSWTYDYSTRTYHLTLEDGSLLDIEFGDGSIKVTLNGKLTQEYYYTVEKGEDPGPTPTPEPGGPTPTPDPGTTPTPEPGPEPEDPDGFFAWLKQWLIDFKEWLGDWLDKLFNKETGDITIDESDNSIHIENKGDIDYDIYYTDDTGEQRKTSLRDLLHKFDFLRDIYDIGRDLFAVVGADAAMAHAYNSSGSTDITPYLGDLRTVAAADVMPIAGGAGAPSLKMNLGAANSHYGFEYGGEVEILDLSWYTPYKATVDNLLSGFLWLFFAWRLFKHAPNIVSGAGMVTDKAEDIHDGKRH